MDPSEALGTYEYPSTLKAFRSSVDFGLACNIQRANMPRVAWQRRPKCDVSRLWFLGTHTSPRAPAGRPIGPPWRTPLARFTIALALAFWRSSVKAEVIWPPTTRQAPPAIVVQFGAHFQTVRQDHVVGTQQAVQARKNPKMRGGTAVLGGLPAVDREASVHITLEQTHRWLSVSRARSLP